MRYLTEAAGLAGAVLAGAAYLPQIIHLIRERCSAGISRTAFLIWLASSALVGVHAVAIGAGVFIVLATVQIAAISVILVHASLYANSYCDTHSPARGRSPDRSDRTQTDRARQLAAGYRS
jgi:uncharacterized protein with PQ loop repeat